MAQEVNDICFSDCCCYLCEILEWVSDDNDEWKISNEAFVGGGDLWLEEKL